MARPSMQEKVKEMLQEADLATRKKTVTNVDSARKTETAPERTFDIENNPFFKVVFDPALSQEEKSAAIAKLLTFDAEKSREQNEQVLKEFDLFKSYLQYERQKMAQKIIELSDTEAFSEMHTMFNEIQGAMKEFDDSLKPLADILDAVFKLRSQGGETTLDIFKEIQEDKIAQARRAEEIKAGEEQLIALRKRVDEYDRTIARLQEKKTLPVIGRSFLGLGGISAETKGEIAATEVDRGKVAEEKSALEAKLQELRTTPANETKFQQWAFEKEKLRELLDISSDEHKERQKRLVNSAQDFVNTTDERVTEVLSHFGKMAEQINTLGEANQGIQVIYAIITDASTTSIKATKEKHTALSTGPNGESAISRMQRETKKAQVEDYIANMDGSAQDTVKTFADLTEQGARINTMKNANREQVSKARDLQSSGVAEVADGLSTLLTGISAAALNESAEMAKATITVMNDRTDTQNMQESLRQAMGIKTQASDLERAIDSLAAYRETAAAVTETTRENLQQVNDAQARLKALITEAKLQIDQTVGVHAELHEEKPAATAPAAEGTKPAAPTVTTNKRPSLGDLAPK